MSLIRVENYINGRLQPPASEEWLDVANPATGEVIADCPNSGPADVDQAVKAASQAVAQWSRLPTAERSAWLLRLADLVERDLQQMALWESQDTGKPLSLARDSDLPRAIANLRFFAGAIQGFSSQSHAMPEAINYTLRRPLGVVAIISPWNFPLHLLTWKVAPALAVGNGVVAKPSELTPLTAYRLAQLCQEAGLPAGVLNIVNGQGATTGDALVRHPRVRAVSFTGGTRTGRQIAATIAPEFKRISLEMGGKNPNVIFADCDYPRMLDTTLRSSFANQGQICLCGSRILVEKPIYERFRNDLIARATALRVGDPLQPDTQLGAVISAAHQEKILGHIERARRDGGIVHCGGHKAIVPGRCAGGWFVEPTIIDGLGPGCSANQEEIFGPVVTLQPFSDESEAVRLANDVPYGLSATLWTSNVGRAHRLAEQLEAGVIWINCWLVRDLRTPFGGMKQSGLGREGGEDALRFFTEPKNVCVGLN